MVLGSLHQAKLANPLRNNRRNKGSRLICDIARDADRQITLLVECADHLRAICKRLGIWHPITGIDLGWDRDFIERNGLGHMIVGQAAAEC